MNIIRLSGEIGSGQYLAVFFPSPDRDVHESGAEENQRGRRTGKRIRVALHDGIPLLTLAWRDRHRPDPAKENRQEDTAGEKNVPAPPFHASPPDKKAFLHMTRNCASDMP